MKNCTSKQSAFTSVFFLLSFIIYAQPDADKPILDKAQVIAQDLVVQGSECVGFDCVNGESFGFDTQRLKENNLRIHFNDTSNSASFPTNDWRIVINDTGNGGASYFGIEDSDAGRMPFRVEAGAPANALYVESDGDVGIKTANPVVDLHIVEGNTPTLRLEQDGSDGFTPQTWDVAGNEANFFVRDITNGSRLSFRIRPGAPESSIEITNDGGVKMSRYGAGNESGTAAYLLGVEADGDVVEVDLADGVGQNIYNSDGALTGERTISLNNHPLNYQSISSIDMRYDASIGSGNVAMFDLSFRNDNVIADEMIARLSVETDDSRRNGRFVFKTGEAGVLSDVLTIDRRKRVGLNTSEPGQSLDIAEGTIRLQEFGTGARGGVQTYLLGVEADGDIVEVPLGANSFFDDKEEERKLEKALQARDYEIQSLNDKIDALIDRMEVLEDLLSSREIFSLENDQLVESNLSQNIPNPFDGKTIVNVTIQEIDNNEIYSLRILGRNGEEIKTYELSNIQVGSNALELDFSSKESGTYFYQLIKNKEVLETKKMVLVR